MHFMELFGLILTRTINVLPELRLATARQSVLQNCDLVVDIGANNGQWITAVRSLGFNGDVICIEPLKKNILN